MVVKGETRPVRATDHEFLLLAPTLRKIGRFAQSVDEGLYHPDHTMLRDHERQFTVNSVTKDEVESIAPIEHEVTVSFQVFF